MKTILYATLTLLMLGLATLPVASADHGHSGETCVEPAGEEYSACVTTTFCYGFEMCIDLTDWKGNGAAVKDWVERQIGPCTCDPQPQPW